MTTKVRPLKVIIIGNIAMGKTSIIERYVKGTFLNNYKSTIGVGNETKHYQYDPQTLLQINLWDIAGQERFDSLAPIYYRDADGAIIVHDIQQPDQIDSVRKWKKKLDTVLLDQGSPSIPVVLFFNKIDLNRQWLNEPDQQEQVRVLCEETGILDYFLTSAKENTQIEGGFRQLFTRIIGMNNHRERVTGGGVELEKKAENNSSCCFT